MKSSAKRDRVIIVVATVLLFLICAAATIFKDMYDQSHYVPPEPKSVNYDYMHDIVPLEMDYITHYDAYKFWIQYREEYVNQHSEMSEEELSKDEEYIRICNKMDEAEAIFLQAEQEAYDKYKLENFGEKVREGYGVHTFEEDKAIERRNTILKWTLPFAAAILCGLIIVLVLRRRKKNERIYWEKQEEKKKMRETEAS